MRSAGSPFGRPNASTARKFLDFVRAHHALGERELIAIIETAFAQAYEQSQAQDLPVSDRSGGLPG